MSHYIVLVIGNSKNDYEDILAPYDENIPDDEPHIDRTKEEIHKEFIECYGSIVAENKPKSELSDFEKLTLTLKKENTKWVDQWCGQRLDKEGNTLSNYNRDSKWDWYEVGGRWSGLLTLKPGEKGLLGHKSWWNEKAEIPENCFDQAYNRQIDWYCLLRHAQGDLEAYSDGLKYMENNVTFLKDSLFCEWGYVINLTTNKLEIYRGFQKKPQDTRYKLDVSKNGYYNCALIREIPLSQVKNFDMVEFEKEIEVIEGDD